MDVTALNGEYRASSRSIAEDVSSVVTLMGGCGFGERAFSRSPTAVREEAVEKWLAAEDEEGALAATEDRMVFDEGEGEDASEEDDDCFFSRGLFLTWTRMDSIRHHCASVSLIAIVAHMIMEMRLGRKREVEEWFSVVAVAVVASNRSRLRLLRKEAR